MGSVDGRIPSEAVKAVLGLAGVSGSDVSTYVTGEEGLLLPSDVHGVVVDHHEAHAASAFYTSGLEDATVLVCDRHSEPELSAWTAGPNGLKRLELAWHGSGFATLYSVAAEALGFRPRRDEHKLEALARIGSEEYGDPCSRLKRFS